MKITILYFSATGNTQKAADYIKEGIQSAGDIDVQLMNIADYANIDDAFINDSSAVIFGTPTYVADMCWQMKRWFDEYRNCKLAGKIGAAFATANFLHGGADIALKDILSHAITKGMLAYASGAGCGVPFIHLGPVALKDQMEEKKELFNLFGNRIASKTLELFG